MRNYGIQELISEAYQEKVSEKNTRDIGKFLQFVAEGYARRWLREVCDIENDGAENDEKGNEFTWDIITEGGLRVQVKYRGGKQGKSGRPKLFLETTRRNSQKNAGAKSASGHVAYGSDEFDAALFVIPKDGFDYNNTDGLEVLVIPVAELVHPDHPDILLKNVPAVIMDKYRGKAKETILSLEHAE
tara:strand:- start:996 stop:1556 length:561 start_codon:yes stop_codon:yes gene_type:complete